MADKTEARLALEARAKKLGVEFAPNIGDEKLQARVDEAQPKAGEPPAAAEAGASAATTEPAEPAGAAQAAPKDAAASDAAEDAGSSEAEKSTEPTADPGAVVTVVGPKKGRWRAGRHFTREAVEIPLDELAEGELAALKGDPRLVVTEP